MTPPAKKLASADLESTSTVQPEKSPTKANLVGEPRFVRCQLLGPDGKTRPGWELWLGEHCFGRADHQAMLLASLERQQQPPQSFHWREVHRQRFAHDRNLKEAKNADLVEADKEAS